MFTHDPFDPLTSLLAPPENETPEQRVAREKAEATAKKKSEKIDEELKQEQARLKKEMANVVKVLLLGQSESGKSTTLKNFRMAHARAAWIQERQSWRSVVQLNLLKSIHTILAVLERELAIDAPVNSVSTFSVPTSVIQLHPSSQVPIALASGATYAVSSSNPLGYHDYHDTSETVPHCRVKLKEKFQLLKLRLMPLRQIEQVLKKRLGAASDESYDVAKNADDYGSALMHTSGDDDINGAQALADLEAELQGVGAVNSRRAGMMRRSGQRRLGVLKGSGMEVGVRVWKDALQSLGASAAKAMQHGKGSARGQRDDNENGLDEATDLIASCREDIKDLWDDLYIRAVLHKHNTRLEDSPGFFLDDLDRIAQREYQPTDEDIVRARLRTLAVQEYRVQFDQNTSNQLLSAVGLGVSYGSEWIIYDVGGSRTLRHAWFPYFDNVNAIIFLAPISCFNEYLSEDPTVNRLEDSFSLWKDICSSKLLAKATLILFLNKCDLLRRKLKSGVKFKDSMPKYGNQPNDAVAVYKYLRELFKDTLKKCSTESRVSYYYGTSVTDVKATATTLRTVRDAVLREHLRQADLM